MTNVLAESGSNYNSFLYPDLPQDIWWTVSQTIQGSSTNTGPVTGCPSGSYNWDYQANLLQGFELGHSYIQQVVEVSQSGNSCYGVYFFPNIIIGKNYFYYSFAIAPSSILYEASSSSDISVSMSYTGSSTYTVTAFYMSACCSNGNALTWVIYPSQMKNVSSGQLLSSAIQFDKNSQEVFNIIGTYGGAAATFSSGSGQINYCSYNNAGNVVAGTGETSNMVYSVLSQNVCGSGNLNLFYQSFNTGTPPTPSVTVQSVDQNDNEITGYHTVLYNEGGKALYSGFTPVTFPSSDLAFGVSYSVGPENYGSCTFNHWQDTGSTIQDRGFNAYGSQTFTAVYDCSSGGSGSVTVNTVDQNNNPISGYYVGLYNSGGTLINHGFSPVTFSGLTIGTNYSVEPDNYGSCTFNHWLDTGSTVRDREFTAASLQTFTAVYDCT